MKFDFYNRKWSHGEEEVAMTKKARGHLGVLRKGRCTEKAKSQQKGQAATRGSWGM